MPLDGALLQNGSLDDFEHELQFGRKSGLFFTKNGTLGADFGTALQRHYIATRPRQDK
jgi:hypothetical protein